MNTDVPNFADRDDHVHALAVANGRSDPVDRHCHDAPNWDYAR